MHVAMEMTFEHRMTFDPGNLHKPNILLQQVDETILCVACVSSRGEAKRGSSKLEPCLTDTLTSVLFIKVPTILSCILIPLS